jgi:filamentous hemagglutinin family protein
MVSSKRTRHRSKQLKTLITFFVLSFISGQAFGLPQIENVVSGTAKVKTPNGNTMQIDTSDKSIINFKSFDIGEKESVVFRLPDASGKVLNRVTGGSHSSILGSLKSNGTVFLINEKGILFGPNSSVNMAGLVASTRNISDNDFLNGNYTFSRSSEGEDRLLLNEGKINIKDGGFAVLIGGAVENKGSILCQVGKVAMAAGDKVRISFPSQGNISVVIDQKTAQEVLDYNGKPVSEQIKNTGTVNADGGMVLLKAEAVQGLLSKAINLDGFVKAEAINGKEGKVQLVSNNDIKVNGKIAATDIALDSQKAITSEGTMQAEDKIALKANGAIESTGILKAAFLDEEGATFILGGESDIGDSRIKNADNAMYLGSGYYSGTYSDVDKIIIRNGSVVRLNGHTTFRSDSDRNGKGYFNMWSGSKIIGNNYDLNIYASTGSRLRDITGIRNLNLYASRSGSNPNYGAANKISMSGSTTINSAVLDMDHNDLRTNKVTGYLKGANYYVDSVNGNDSRAGTSIEIPWKSLDKVNSKTFRPKDHIKFKRGGVWRGQLQTRSGDSTGYIYYTAYGSGSMPRIMGSANLNKEAGWTYLGSNRWQKKNTAFAYDVGNLIFNNGSSFGSKKWSRSDLKAQGDFWYDRANRALVVYSTSRPTDRYSNIEAALRRNIVEIGGRHHVLIEKLDLRNGGAHGIAGKNTSYITIQDNRISYIGGGDQNNIGDGIRFGNGIEFMDSAHDTVVRRNYIDQVYDAGITTQGTSNGNKKYNQYFYDNVVNRAEYGFEYFNITPKRNSNTYNIYVDNNTFLNSGGGWAHNQRPHKKGTALFFGWDNGTFSKMYVRNNIFKNATQQLVTFNNHSNVAKYTMDYNLYHTNTGRAVRVENYNRNYSPSAFNTWRSTYGKDAHSRYADPKLTSTFKLTSSSPAVNRGTNLSYIKHDYFKSARFINGAMDIGAHEYNPY